MKSPEYDRLVRITRSLEPNVFTEGDVYPARPIRWPFDLYKDVLRVRGDDGRDVIVMAGEYETVPPQANAGARP